MVGTLVLDSLSRAMMGAFYAGYRRAWVAYGPDGLLRIDLGIEKKYGNMETWKHAIFVS